ncbi:STAS domain-containing protein [Polaromonas sp. YR568]|uniref:STAS domain-containing protein n=1 Tax=Polaromonas sp. YR568 TaxID=1855301 RepID=UPI003137B724
MSKEDTGSGLLSKMVKFVRNPATNWAELDSSASDRDEAMSKQLLKEMIERKRRNDFVRKREFDMLRKMRKREAMVGVGQDQTGRPSFFQSSLPSKPDDRATTLKKIDEIEAQMSMQWWKTKHAGVADQSTHVPLHAKAPPVPSVPDTSQPLDNALPTAYKLTAPNELPKAPPPGESLPMRDFLAPTQPDGLAVALAAARAASAQPRPPPPAAPQSPAAKTRPGSLDGYEGSTSGFSHSKLTAVDFAEVVNHDPDVEEAAIRFANGDDAGAEAGLLEILGPGGSRAQHPDTWLTLFDLYRATAQQEKFETAAIQFVERFDRSAPQWFSMPDMVKQLSQPVGKAAGGQASDWVCPSVLGIQTVAALKAAMAKAAMPWRLDWSNLKTMEAAAIEPLHKVVLGWAAQPVQLRFIGDDQLLKVLNNATPSGDRNIDQSWWLLRLTMLRVMNQADDFELAALDFCVTYEVSPPAWESARCEYRPIDAQGGVVASKAIISDVYRDSMPSSLSAFDGDTHMEGASSQMSNLLSVELSGQIQGDAIEVLDKLEAKFVGTDMMVVSCAKLIRVDFSAAGSLLNWVSARQSEHRTVHFSDVNRLVASFFNVIGITEHARVLIRAD